MTATSPPLAATPTANIEAIEARLDLNIRIEPDQLRALLSEVKAHRAALLAIHELAAARLEDESPGGVTLFEIERLSR